MELFESELGRLLKVRDVAKITGLDTRTVRKYYKSLGGVKLGDRRFLFSKGG